MSIKIAIESIDLSADLQGRPHLVKVRITDDTTGRTHAFDAEFVDRAGLESAIRAEIQTLKEEEQTKTQIRTEAEDLARTIEADVNQ